jgi:hypothetical protein
MKSRSLHAGLKLMCCSTCSGPDSGFKWDDISDPTLTEDRRRANMTDVIERGLAKNLFGIPGRDLRNDNEALGMIPPQRHLAREISLAGVRVSDSDEASASDLGDDRMNYRIELL